jgi:hypothetical protein
MIRHDHRQLAGRAGGADVNERQGRRGARKSERPTSPDPA